MRKDDLIDVSLNKERGSSITLIGGISNRWDNMEYIITDKTTKVNFNKFLKHIKNHITSNCVMVLDNHSAHRNVDSVNLAWAMGIKLHFLPATASELNPVERMWSFFKKKWRQRLYNPEFTITKYNCIDHIKVVLDQIKGMGKKLAEGPMSHMIKWCNPIQMEPEQIQFRFTNT